MLIKTFMRFQKPAGDDGSDTGGSVDRGDNLPDIDPEDPDAELAAAEAEAKLRKELADKEKGESEDEDEDEDGDEPKAKKKDSRIPLSRHKEILEKERAARAELEQRLAQYQHGGEVANINENITAIENEVLKMEREYTKELADGELDKAAAIMSKIRQAERQITEAKGDMKIQAAEARATERARYNIALERIESAFPVLNPDHDSFDAETMQDVVELKDAYQMKGLTPTAALQKAVNKLVEPRTTKQEIATTSTPRVNEKDVSAERKTEAVKKTAEAVKKTPPNLSKVGLDGDKLGGGKLNAQQVMNLSQKEFAQLSEADLAQMRGDIL